MLVERLGADVVIDYTAQAFEDHVRGMDGVFDLLGGENVSRKAFGVVKPGGGKVVSIAGLPEPVTARKDLTALSHVSSGLRAMVRVCGSKSETARHLSLSLHASQWRRTAELDSSAGNSNPSSTARFSLSEIKQAFARRRARQGQVRG